MEVTGNNIAFSTGENTTKAFLMDGRPLMTLNKVLTDDEKAIIGSALQLAYGHGVNDGKSLKAWEMRVALGLDT